MYYSKRDANNYTANSSHHGTNAPVPPSYYTSSKPLLHEPKEKSVERLQSCISDLKKLASSNKVKRTPGNESMTFGHAQQAEERSRVRDSKRRQASTAAAGYQDKR